MFFSIPIAFAGPVGGIVSTVIDVSMEVAHASIPEAYDQLAYEGHIDVKKVAHKAGVAAITTIAVQLAVMGVFKALAKPLGWVIKKGGEVVETVLPPTLNKFKKVIIELCEKRGKEVISKIGYDNKIPRVGSEWNEYFVNKYGAENVEWVSKHAEIDSIIKKLQGNAFKNNPLRMAYEDEVRNLANYVDELYRRGYTEKEIAQIVNQARRELGIVYKDATPQPLRDYIYHVNNVRYKAPLGPTYDDFVEMGYSDLKIIKKASRPNTDIDKLLEGFKEWMVENYDITPR